MPITELNHYLLVAKDLERTKDFYQKVLGLELADRPDFGFPGYWLKTGEDICVHLASQDPNETRDMFLLKKHPKGTAGSAWDIETGERRPVIVAVLDTGLDLRHGDYAGRSVVSSSFVEGESAQDGNGHGTHCIGTAAGPSVPGTLPRYGVAGDAEIYAGKVISDRGRGSDGSVLAGLNWAIGNGCRIVSMSLGTATQPGQAYSQVYESVAQRALAANTLLIAAAGNESRRDQGQINPVGHPANCPSVMAVGAIDSDMQIANFSTRGTGGNGGAIDLVAPGVDVYSTIPPSTRGHMSGTSMACPHVAGIAALYVEAHPNASAREIWDLMVRNARRLNLDAADAGAGLVQAPR